VSYAALFERRVGNLGMFNQRDTKSVDLAELTHENDECLPSERGHAADSNAATIIEKPLRPWKSYANLWTARVGEAILYEI
jgi:hypothetical protein